MEVAANPSRYGTPLLLTTNDLGHGSGAEASLLRLPGPTTASPSGDLEQQQSPDEEKMTTVTCGMAELHIAGDADAPHKICTSSLPLQSCGWRRPGPMLSPTSGTSSMARSSALTTMIPQRTRSSTISPCFPVLSK